MLTKLINIPTILPYLSLTFRQLNIYKINIYKPPNSLICMAKKTHPYFIGIVEDHVGQSHIEFTLKPGYRTHKKAVREATMSLNTLNIKMLYDHGEYQKRPEIDEHVHLKAGPLIKFIKHYVEKELQQEREINAELDEPNHSQ
jgi:hypothetical protein